MLIQKGAKGPHVTKIQKALDAAGFWTYGKFTETYGDVTEDAVEKFQSAKALTIDGEVGPKTLAALGITLSESDFPTTSSDNSIDDKYKDVTIQGSVFPDKPIKDNLSIKLTKEMVDEYLPALDKAMGDQPRGFKLLCTIMAQKEGFYKGTRSYSTNNPGNIGNTDSGANKKNKTLVDGILLQKNYILSIVEGKHTAFPMGKKKVIKPYYSPEIAKNAKTYQMSPYVPGYEFVFTGQLDQFVKIYATGARAGNSYLSMIISYFKMNGVNIGPESKLQDIIKIQ
ncbi:MAG: peptidoglycan-binding domain-containing protein [Nanoarchaeota archaeon]